MNSMNSISAIAPSRLTPYLKHPDVLGSLPYVDFPGSGRKWGEYKMQLALLNPDAPTIMQELDGIVLNDRQAVDALGLERNEAYCCWYYELTAGILEKAHVGNERETFIINAAFLNEMLVEDAEAPIELMAEAKIKIKNDWLQKASTQGGRRVAIATPEE